MQQLEVLKQALSRISLEELGLQGRSGDCSCTSSRTCLRCSGEYGCSPALPISLANGMNSSFGSGLPAAIDLNPIAQALPTSNGRKPHAVLPPLKAIEAPEGADELPRPPITYLHIYEDGALSLGIFCLPAHARIPLHNHPGMTVLSRVLYGQMHVKSCDWLDPGAPDHLPREAVKVLDNVFCSADDPIALFPASGGNIHQFTAVTDCAVLDLMSPPYCTEAGRDCSYYRCTPGSGHSPRGDVTLLESFEPPADFVIEHAEYQGMPVRPLKSAPQLQQQQQREACAAAAR